MVSTAIEKSLTISSKGSLRSMSKHYQRILSIRIVRLLRTLVRTKIRFENSH